MRVMIVCRAAGVHRVIEASLEIVVIRCSPKAENTTWRVTAGSKCGMRGAPSVGKAQTWSVT